MAQFSTVTLDKNDLISYVVFSCWDNTAGPTPKRVWADTPIPDSSEIKLLTRLVLKSEVTRDPKSAHIDCNVYNLADQGVCAVSYLFTGVARSRIGSRIFCLILVCKAENRARYLQWSSIIDPVVKQGIAEYKVKLHKDFEAHAPGKTKVLTSNNYLNEMISNVIKLINRMTSTGLDPDRITVEQTLFFDKRQKYKEKPLLTDTISAMLLSFNCIVVVGSEKYADDVKKWVRTLSLLMNGSHKRLCFLPGKEKHTDIIPNAKVQGIISDEELRKGKGGEFLMTLYTKCTYPVAILELGKTEVVRTANYKLHQFNCDDIRLSKLRQIFSTNPPGQVDLDGIQKDLNQMQQDSLVRTDPKSPRLNTFIDQNFESQSLDSICCHFFTACGDLLILYPMSVIKWITFTIEPVGRIDYIKQWITVLQSQALALTDFLKVTSKPKPTKERVARDEIKKYQLINDEADLELLLCVAESLHAGVYEYVIDESIDTKAKAVNNTI